MAAESYFSAGNAAFVDDDFVLAIKKYTEAIELNAYNPDYYIKRAEAHIKVDNNEDAIKDCESALNLQKDNAKIYLRKGTAEFNLERYKDAQATFLEGQKYDTESKEFKTWLRKCKAELDLKEEEEGDNKESKSQEEIQELNSTKNTSSNSTTPSPPAPDPAPAPAPAPVQPKARYDWYQTDSFVVINMMVKNTKKEDVHVDITEDTFSANIKLSSDSDYTLDFDLAHHVNIKECRVRIMSTKVEVKLKKVEGIHWTSLERDDASPTLAARPKGDEKGQARDSHQYPTSCHVTRNWDRVARDIDKEEEEQTEGDAALNQLFQKIYGDGSDEVKRAMNKSFMESGGTVLSTNWGDIGKGKVEMKPPDGMEFKKWDG